MWFVNYKQQICTSPIVCVRPPGFPLCERNITTVFSLLKPKTTTTVTSTGYWKHQLINVTWLEEPTKCSVCCKENCFVLLTAPAQHAVHANDAPAPSLAPSYHIVHYSQTSVSQNCPKYQPADMKDNSPCIKVFCFLLRANLSRVFWSTCILWRILFCIQPLL